MPILIGEVSHPNIGQRRIEISKPESFIARVKEINREIKRGKRGDKEPMKLWKIRAVGDERIPVAVQRLIEASNETTESAEDSDRLGEAIKDLEAVQQEHGIVVPPNPGARPARRARPGGAL